MVVKQGDVIQTRYFTEPHNGTFIPILHEPSLQTAKGAFHHGIVLTIAFPAHTVLEAICCQ
jgi:hypothetical protein